MNVPSVGSGSSSLAKPICRFNGFYYSKLDFKKRFSVPAQFRKLFTPSKIYLSLEPTKSGQAKISSKKLLLIYPESTWLDKLKGLSTEKREELSAFSFPASIDKTGRVLIPSHILSELNFTPGDELAVVGRGKYMQVLLKREWI